VPALAATGEIGLDTAEAVLRLGPDVVAVCGVVEHGGLLGSSCFPVVSTRFVA
jgi:hypothetical protein